MITRQVNTDANTGPATIWGNIAQTKTKWTARLHSHSKASASGTTTTHAIEIAAEFTASTKQTEQRVHMWGPACAQIFSP